MSSPPRYTDGAAIRAVREQRNITQVALADAVGVSQVWISRVESGQQEASLGLLCRLADHLGLDRGPFLRRNSEQRPERPEAVA